MKKIQLHSFKGEHRLVFFGTTKKKMIMFPIAISKKDSKIVEKELREKILSDSESGGIVMNLNVDRVQLHGKKITDWKIFLSYRLTDVAIFIEDSDAKILLDNFKNHLVKSKIFDYYSFM